MVAKIIPKLVQKLIILGFIFGSLFLRFLGSLGASWESSWVPKALLGGLWTSKTMKNHLFLKVFANPTFLVLEALDERLGAHLGPFLGRATPK